MFHTQKYAFLSPAKVAEKHPDFLQVLDMMAMSRFIRTMFMMKKIAIIHKTAQSLVISSKYNSPATNFNHQTC